MHDGDATNGDKLDLKIGSYQLLEPLGSGGMSSVFRAVHAETGHEVAVKVLPRSLAKNPSMLQRFLREATTAEALEHPNIVAIYDRGVDRGRNYLVLEYVAGGDLYDRVRVEGPLAIAAAVAVVRSVAEGLKYALTLGLIHRDIKPANILVSPSGQVKIIDLGLALRAESEDERVTRDGTTVGTVDYMAPEQARDSRATSARSDIYSLGCTFYYLLTGSAPFPGGDIADKMNRHCTKPAPDACALRPEVPRPLGLLIRKMMAKKPENRIKDYDELLATLAAIPIPEAGTAVETLDVLVDEGDEDDDEGGIPLAPLESERAVARVASKDRSGEAGSPHASTIDLAELAGGDAPHPPTPGRRPPTTAHMPRRDATTDDLEPMLDADEDASGEGQADEEVVEGLGSGRFATAPEGVAKTSNLKWIYASIGGCVALVVLVVVVNLMIGPAKTPDPDPDTVAGGAVEAPQFAPEPDPIALIAPVAAPVPSVIAPVAPAPPPATTSTQAAVPKVATKSLAIPAWVEPGDPDVEVPADLAIAPEVEARFPLPAWAKAPIPPRLTGNLLKVRRVNDPASSIEKASIGQAFEQIGSSTTELIDNGPFIETDLRMRGDAHLLRAGPGRRPILRIDRPRLDILKEQPALFVLDGKHLYLDGIDLIVNVQDLSRKNTALFSCKGGGLTLHNCTITVVNSQNLPFTLIRAAGNSRPSQIRVEDSYLRGSSMSMVEVVGGGVEVAIVRSVLLGGQGPLVAATGNAPAGDRKIHLDRSVLANRGPIFEMSTPDASRPTMLTVRALGSTFARFRSDPLLSLVAFRDPIGDVKDVLNWLGEHNSFLGWNDWSSIGNGHLVKVASLAEARATWGSTDALSHESPNPWPVPPDFNRVIPEQMRTLAPQGLSTLLRVAAPSPYLFEKTIDEFKRPEPPTFVSPIPTIKADENGNLAVIEPDFNQGSNPGFNPNPADAVAAPGDPNTPAPDPAAAKELTFEVTAAPWRGDLGLYLREQVKAGDRRVRVRVAGTGSFNFTPVRLPDGTSLEVIVESSRVKVPVPPSWKPTNVGTAEALIDVKGGDLVLNGVELYRDASSRPRYLIRVDEGHLVLNRCRLHYTEKIQVAEPGTGHLISFRAASTRLLPNRPWPFATPFDKPVCRIIDTVLVAPGDVLHAEVGRGMIALTQCLVAAGGTIFTLDPARVARGRFEADLLIERCTFAAEKTFVQLGPWPGSTPGPDRPWLVSSRASAYVSGYAPASKESVLLRVEPNSLAGGTLFWQGSNDAYDVTNFTGRTDRPTVANPFPDFFIQWAKIWGANHFREPSGPSRGTKASVAFYERLKPISTAARVTTAHVTAGDLVLDPDHPGRAPHEIGADVRLLQITPNATRTRGRPGR